MYCKINQEYVQDTDTKHVNGTIHVMGGWRFSNFECRRIKKLAILLIVFIKLSVFAPGIIKI